MHFITKKIKESLTAKGTQDENERQMLLEKARRYFPEGFRAYTGIQKTETKKFVNTAVRAYGKPLDLEERLRIGEELFKDRLYEECQAAIILLEKGKKALDEGSLTLFTKWIDTYVENWAVCDSFCIGVVNYVFKNHPELLEILVDEWAIASCRWRRRAACVTLLKACPVERFDLIFSLGKKLMDDEEKYVQKGLGWLLKNTARTIPEEVISFLNENKKNITGIVRSEVKQALAPEQKRRIV